VCADEYECEAWNATATVTANAWSGGIGWGIVRARRRRRMVFVDDDDDYDDDDP